ncbi:MFS transporter [Streptomyces sp. NBC_00201]|uniref:MFS transporter n=1 Tax=unclassified Streptomyces TaxID=2593676 RepID=UPI002251FEDB|nr:MULTISPECIES: MFS transporter [unclassified Streptomyces]MCX5250885.1 MFS transporter [Streptomyces sp. NBC_00201]MCX5291186.1 MFS transporter [Streptomyces sp. NBC_00183]
MTPFRIGRGRETPGKRTYLVALTVDCVGNGLWTPVALIFFTRAQHLPLAHVGAALTVGGLLGLLAGPVNGLLVDRWGPANGAALSYAVRTGAFALFPFVSATWQVGALAVVAAAADRLFWTASTPLLARLVPAEALLGVLSTASVLKVSGWAAGGAIGATAGGLLIDSGTGLHLVAYANGLTYAAAMVLVLTVRRHVRPSSAAEPPADGRAWRWRDLRDDPGFLRLCLLTLLLAFVSDCLTAMLPVVVIVVLGQPSWVPGVVIAVACVSMAVARRPAVAYARRVPAPRVLRLACCFLTLAVLVMAPSGWAGPATTAVVLCAALIGTLGDALFAPVVTTTANAAAPPGLEGRYNATFQTSFGIAGAVAPAAGTALLAHGNTVLWLGLAVVCAGTALSVGFLTRPTRPVAAPAPAPLRRIVVGGISGAGKTTLAAALAGALDIRHIEMDALYHGPGWTHRAEFADDVERATRTPAWICDAQYHWVVGDLLGERADTFVWLDLSRRTVMNRVLRRSVVRAATGRELWHGNRETWRSMLRNPRHPLRWAWSQHATRRAETAAFLRLHPGLAVVHLTSASQARQWLRSIEHRPLSPAPSPLSAGGTPMQDRRREPAPPGEPLLEIHGGSRLSGSVRTSGFKHSLVTTVAAAATASAPVRIGNCPDIVETTVLGEIFRAAGAHAHYDGPAETFTVDASAWDRAELPSDLVGRIHGSLYLLPALVSRNGVARLPASGGCTIGEGPRGRPVEHMLDVMGRFGVTTRLTADGSVDLTAQRLTPCTIDMLDYTRNKALMSGPCYSGAVKTALLMGAVTQGTTTLHHPYLKPDVTDMVTVLRDLGADIEFAGPETWVVHGRGPQALDRPADVTLIPDLIEVVTWICAGVLLADEPLRITGPGIDRAVHALAPEFDLLDRMGVRVDVGADEVTAHPLAKPLRPVEFTAMSRGVFSDSQPFLALLAAYAEGPTHIREAVWEHRFGFAPELEALGMRTAVDDTVLRVDGPCPPYRPGTDLHATDLRAAAVLLLAALAVPGRTTLRNHHHLARGYRDLVEDLVKLGADIRHTTAPDVRPKLTAGAGADPA